MISRWWVKIERFSSLLSDGYVSLETRIRSFILTSETFFKNPTDQEKKRWTQKKANVVHICWPTSQSWKDHQITLQINLLTDESTTAVNRD